MFSIQQCNLFEETSFQVKPLAAFPGIWNQGIPSPPQHTWLAVQQSQEDRNRLRMMGNCIVPSMANLAMNIFAGMTKDQPKK